MSWLSKLRAGREAAAAAVAADQQNAELVSAFAAFYSADSPPARAATLQGFMVTTDYDAWLAGYLRQVWESDEERALWGEQYRFMLRGVHEGDLDALVELDPEFPPAWRARLAAIATSDSDRPAKHEGMTIASRLSDLLEEPDGLSDYQRSQLHLQAGHAYGELWDSVEGTEMIDAALTHYDRALELSPQLDCVWSRILGAAAMMHNKRYDVTKNLRSVDLTLHCAETAITTALPGQLGLADFHGVWAAGLRNAAILVEDALYWHFASSAASQAAALSRNADPRRPFYVASAGAGAHNARIAPLHAQLPSGLRGSSTVEMERAMVVDPTLRERITIVPKNDRDLEPEQVPTDLDGIIAAEDERWRGETPGSTGAAGTGIGLGRLLLTRHEQADQPDGSDLVRADQLSLAGLHAKRPDDLLSAYVLRADVLEVMDASPEVVEEMLGKGLDVADRYPSDTGLRVARRLGDRLGARQDWSGAAAAYDTAVSIHARLVQRQVGRDYQDKALAWGPSLGVSAAVAHVRAGAPARAAESLESSRAQLLSMTLRRDGADVDRIRESAGEDLADRYASALLRLGGAVREEEPDAAAQRAQDDLAAAVEDIRRLPGFADFLRPLGADEMADVAASVPGTIVFLAESEPAGIAVVVGKEVGAALVEGLDHATARRIAEGLTAEPGTSRHAAALEQGCVWLGDALAPALASLDLAETLVVVPCGLLSALPVHAARTSSGTHLFDDHDVRYAANVEALRAGLRSGRARLATATVLQEDSKQEGRALPYAAFEASVVADALGRAEAEVDVVLTSGTSPEAVMAALARSDLLHAACHAVADPEQPLHSGLVLDGQRLTIADVEAAEVTATLVVLSGCESASTDRRLPDEVVSLPSGLVAAGCAAVIGSLWKVDDEAAALLMARTYDDIADGVHPGLALSRARRWLRDGTNGDLLGHVRAQVEDPTEPGFRRLVARLGLADPDERPFSSPERWAAFVHVGA